MAMEIKLRAERKAGQFLADMKVETKQQKDMMSVC
jgi:hypothetical protein